MAGLIPDAAIPRLADGMFPLRNPRHEIFAQEYARTKNGQKSALAAGYTANSASSRGSQLLNDSVTKARIDFLVQRAWAAESMSAGEVVARLARLARVDVRDVFDENGQFRAPQTLSDQGAAAVAGVESMEITSGTGENQRTVGVVQKVKLRDPLPALRALAEIGGLIKRGGEGMDALAGAIAERMQGRRQARVQDVTDVEARG